MIIKGLGISRLSIVAAIGILSCCQSRHCGHFSENEKALILGADSIMRVLTIEEAADSAVLRAASSDLSAEALLSADFERLAELMLATVTHPSQDGVGIAGPQVGINRRVVAVQRFDKEPVEWGGHTDHPFEVYPNIKIVWKSEDLRPGPEGCLSVPDRREIVLRSSEIVIEYTDMKALKQGESSRAETSLPTVRDTVSGFTAVIFQHEIDHLDGMLYIDRL